MAAKHTAEVRTEDIVRELLSIQGWKTNRLPAGRIVRQNEYKNFPELDEIFKGKSKSGSGDAYPDFMIVTAESPYRPQMVIETKAAEGNIGTAVSEATSVYAEACMAAGHQVIAAGVAGQEDTSIKVEVHKFHLGSWKPVEYDGKPISWLPTPDDLEQLIEASSLLDLKPVVPEPEVLAKYADLINRILREANIKDEFRPAYVGAMMLALWQTRGNVRKHPDFVLHDINSACQQAFATSGKPELAHSLRVDEANQRLAQAAWRIIATLEKLNVGAVSIEHDYLGHLYETFFRYTGANTIGQYFTPRHIARLMADICETTASDIVIDPACGTGGFLIAAMQRSVEASGLTYESAVALVRDKLVGFESEPVTAALAVANMLLRGDGKTGVHKDDCFSAPNYPVGQCDVALMNPPFPHKNTDVPPQMFVERALDALRVRGKLAVILPTSMMVKRDIGEWRSKILAKNTLLAVIQLPDELFQPNASTTTSIVLLEKGIPHDPKRTSVFVRLHYDGFTLKKGIRVRRSDGRDQVQATIDAVLNKHNIPGFSGTASVSGKSEWSPGAYIASAPATEDEMRTSVDDLLRRWASFYVRYASEVAQLRARVAVSDLEVSPYRVMLSAARTANAAALPSGPETIGEMFDIFYGQKELHSREGIPPGDSLVISPTEQYNGCYGWLTFEPLLQPPFVTVAQTGSIGEAFMQTEPCAVNDDCLVLLPKPEVYVSLAQLAIAAAAIRLEQWRFSYGRKLTPARIAEFPLQITDSLHSFTTEKIEKLMRINELAVESYASEVDVEFVAVEEEDDIAVEK